MNRKDVYTWLKEKRGEVTIEEMLHEFSGVDPVEVAEGFSLWVSHQVDGR
jgi:hypothetical protein